MATTPTIAEYDVLVVGAGPAGLTTGIVLARHGLDVLVVEKHDGTSPFPKATGISTRTMEILRSWDLEDDVRAGELVAEPFLAVSPTLLAPALTTVPFGYPTAVEARRVSPTGPAAVPQDWLEPILAAHLRERGGRVAFGTEVVALRDEGAGVTAELRDVHTARPSRVHARYVVGADGPRSGVRGHAGIECEDLGTIGQFLAVTFRADLTRRLARRWALTAVQTPGAEGMFVPTGRDDRWVYAREWHPESGEKVADYPPSRVLAMIRAGSGVPDLEPAVTSVMPFAMGAHVATSFRAGRTFLVGDAAHRTTPVGAVGMNLAIQGAHNLGWKLACVLRGWADPSLLDSYEAERRPIGAAAARQSLDRGPRSTADGFAWDVDARYGPAVAGSVGTGQRAPHVWVALRNGTMLSTLDLVGERLTLFTGPAGAPWAEAGADLDVREGLPVAAFVEGADIVDETGELARRYGLGEAGAVLVAPTATSPGTPVTWPATLVRRSLRRSPPPSGARPARSPWPADPRRAGNAGGVVENHGRESDAEGER